ncbi:MAG: phosphoethanolamine transferase, partial [Bacteroidales bacterium]|nr:phosphoethanolamine transferase [Candidatus Physcousia equi]
MFLFLYILGIASSIVTLPNVKNAHIYANTPEELFLDTYLLCAIVCIVPSLISIRKVNIPLRSILKGVVYLVMYPLYIIDTFCWVKFGTTINPSMLLLMGETNSEEASEFLTSYVSPDVIFSEVGVMLLIMLVHIALAVLLHYKPLKIKVGMKRPYRIVADVLVAALFAYTACMAYDNKIMYAETMQRETIGQVEHDMACQPHTELYQPFMRLPFSIRSNQLVAKQLERLEANVGNVKIDSCSFKSPEIVLIIGESCNIRHSQLYGYDKENTPNQVRMEKKEGLIKMEDGIAPWNLTSFVLKHLMTTYCVGDDKEWCDYPLFCELFRKAGYRVTFLTNQFETAAKQQVYDFSGGFFINNETLSKAQFDHRNKKLHIFDEGLLEDYADIEEQGQPEAKGNLTIFHLMGQHVNYRVRCPNSKKKFRADDYADQTDLKPKSRKVMADYDNATWYNDSVVNQIVERFKDKEAIVIYFSDHGEEVFGPGARHFFGRMHKTDITKRLADEEFRIPMWFYTTKTYQQ